MQLTFRRVEMGIVAFGLTCGVLHAALSPPRYEAVTYLSNASIDAAKIRRLFDRKNLYQVILKADLYAGERSKLPAEDLVAQFRHDVLVIDLGRGDLRLGFRNPDSAEATRGVQALAELLDPGKTLEVVLRKMGDGLGFVGFGARGGYPAGCLLVSFATPQDSDFCH